VNSYCLEGILNLSLGGRFDGVLGVIGALEVLRTIKESGMKTHASIAAIDWTNEYAFSPLHSWRTRSQNNQVQETLTKTSIQNL
jgi:hypothetical protein